MVAKQKPTERSEDYDDEDNFFGSSRFRAARRAALGRRAEDFFKGKTLNFIVGAAPGGGYDTYTRAVARHIGKHIPGNPTSVVQNMTGAGTLIAAHHLYFKSEPDGLTLGAWNSGQVLRQALEDRAVKFEAEKFGWVGAPVRGMPTCGLMGHTGLKTLDDAINTKSESRSPRHAPARRPTICRGCST